MTCTGRPYLAEKARLNGIQFDVIYQCQERRMCSKSRSWTHVFLFLNRRGRQTYVPGLGEHTRGTGSPTEKPTGVEGYTGTDRASYRMPCTETTMSGQNHRMPRIPTKAVTCQFFLGIRCFVARHLLRAPINSLFPIPGPGSPRVNVR